MGLISKLFNFGVKAETPKNKDETMLNDDDFKMIVDDVFTIMGRGIVVTGKIESGEVTVNDFVTVNSCSVQVTGIEMFRKKLDSAHAGENVGLLLKDIDKSMVNKGDVITK